VISRLLKNNSFSKWVDYEFINGYSPNAILPKYREFYITSIKASYIAPHGYGFIKYTNTLIPIQNLGSDRYNEIALIKMRDSLHVILQSLSKNGNIHFSLSPQELLYIQKILNGCQIMSVYKEISNQNFNEIVIKTKSKLLDIFMDFNDSLFNMIISLKGYHPYRWKGYRA